MNKCQMVYKSHVSDEMWSEAYLRMVDSGAERTVFYDGSCKSFVDFYTIMLDPSVHSWVLYYEGEMSGVVWLTGINGRCAHGHVCMFKNVYGRSSDGISKSVILGRFVSSSWLRHTDDNGEHLLDVVIALPPKRNKLAIKWIQKCGAVRRADIPYGAFMAASGRSEDAVLTTITRESTEESWRYA